MLGAYAHAIGQGCGSVHCETHAIGMVIYALTALVRAHGLASCQEVIEARVREEEERLRVWQLREKQEMGMGAFFDEGAPEQGAGKEKKTAGSARRMIIAAVCRFYASFISVSVR